MFYPQISGYIPFFSNERINNQLTICNLAEEYQSPKLRSDKLQYPDKQSRFLYQTLQTEISKRLIMKIFTHNNQINN